MLIGPPQTVTSGSTVRVQVPVTLDTSHPLLSNHFDYWYELPAEYASSLAADRADAFLVGMQSLAMLLHEDITVEAPVSARLVRGLQEYQRAFAQWFPDRRPAEIQHDGFAPELSTGTGTGTFFSGGIDSFHTLWSHLGDREPNPAYRITHGLYLDGFDTDEIRTAGYDESMEAFRSLLDGLGVELIPIRTNLKDFVHEDTTGWQKGYGSLLASNALLMQGLLRRCYVPSGGTYSPDHFTEGSNPLTDPLLSTETLEIIHDGAWATRIEKTFAIAAWPATYDHLYVCFGRGEGAGLENCCRCEKCIRSMIALELAGTLDRYSTFPTPLESGDIRRWKMPYFDVTECFAQDLYETAQRVGRADVARDLRLMLLNHRIRFSALGRLLRRLIVLPAKRSEWISSLYYRLRGARA